MATVEQTNIAKRCLDLSDEQAAHNQEDLPDIDATLFWQTGRGASSLIVGRDGSMLFANSSLSLDAHIDLYKAGRRTNLSEFD